MSDVDAVLERLVTDQVFRTRFRADPVAALGGYDLEAEDLAVLAATLDEGQGSDHGVERRTSKSAVLGVLASLGGGPVTDIHAGTGRGGADGGQASPHHGMGSPYLKKACFDNTDGAMEELVADAGPDGDSKVEALDRPVIVGRVPNPTSPPPPEATDTPPSDGFTAPPDDGDAPMTKSELTQRLARHPSENEAATDGLTPGGGAEETVHPTSPGVYVQEVPAPATGAVPPGTSATVTPPDAGGDAAGSAGLRSDGELVQASATSDVPAAEEPSVEAEGTEVAVETLVLQDDGLDPGPDASVGGDETGTIGADRDITVKGSKIREN